MDIIDIVLSKKYTDESLKGITGTLAGKNCTIQSATKVDGVTTVVFAWTADDGTEETTTIQVNDGAKGDKGDTGADGKDAPQIDDSAITATNPWSSKQIIDMFCPPLEESGNPVVCYPVAGYPLAVKAKWEPMQEGSGDPSPDNVRPIKGRDSVTVERCGENLIDSDRVTEVSETYGLTAQYVSEKITISGIYSGSSTNASFSFMSLSYKLPPTTKFAWLDLKQVGCTLANIRFTNKEHKRIAIDIGNCTNGEKIEISFYLVAYIGIAAPTTYAPYIGQINALTLPETVYGGEVDAVSGEGQETWTTITLDGTENWIRIASAPNPYFLAPILNLGMFMLSSLKAKCTAFPLVNITGNNNNNGFNGWDTSLYIRWDSLSTVDALKSYLASQYAAGTPVQVCYKLTTPTYFTATGAQPIPALAGVNTVFTDADSATVTGRADPIKRITDLEDAVASQT